MKISTFIGTGLVLGLAAMTFAAVDGYLIKMTPKVGDVVKYKLKASLEVMGQQAKVTAITSEKVTKVDEDGTYTVESTQSDLKVQLGEQEIEPPASGATVEVRKANGTLVEIRGENVDSNSYRMNALSALVPSDKPVKVGDTWTNDVKSDAKTGAVAAKAEYKVIGEEKVGDYETLKLKVTVKETEGSEPASSEFTLWLDKANWTMVKLDGKLINAPMPGAPTPVTANMTLERVK